MFELSRKQPSPASAAPSAASAAPTAGSSRPAVLIVDDVAGNLLALEGVLRRDDIEILTAPSGSAALDIFLAREIALAIIDVQMPEMDGFELATLIRGVERTRCIPIIFLTASSPEPARIFKGYEAGAVDYLFKPVNEHIIRSKVDVFVTLAKQRQQLRQSERLREIFMGILGHDLQNPLNGILLTMYTLLGRSRDKEIRELAECVVQSGQRMARMIEQLLDVSRFRLGGGIALATQVVDLQQLIEQVLGEFATERQRLRLEVLGDGCGVWDVDRLLQIVSNLVGNAVHHSPPGSPIRVRIDGELADWVTLTIHNGGQPIPDELRGVLFEPFRGSGSGSKTPRLGLGLYITRELVLAHGGTISFESSAESGTRFIVTLPRQLPGAAPATSDATPAPPPSAPLDMPSQPVVLVVEDEPHARRALGELLGEVGTYQVRLAANAKEALELADAHRTQLRLLITDLQLPGMSGEELAAQLREEHPQLKVIFMSGRPQDSTADELFIQKPLDLAALDTLIERALAQ